MNRIKEIDFIKFIAMIMIVGGHAGVSMVYGIAPVHVALFFTCSGFLLHTDLKFVELLCNSIKKLYLPFIGFSIVFIIFHNYLEAGGWKYTEIQHYYLVMKHSLLMDVTESFLAPMWFLTALFLATVFWGGAKLCAEIIDSEKRIRPVELRQIICVIIMLVGINNTIEGKNAIASSFMNPEIINVSMVSTFFLELGYSYKKCYRSKIKKAIYIISGIFAYLCEILLMHEKKIAPGVRVNEWGNLFYYILLLLLAWHFLYVLGTYITKIKFFYQLVSLVGRNTLWIMALHMLGLKIFEKILPSSGYLYGYIKVIGAILLSILLHGCYNILIKSYFYIKNRVEDRLK